MGRTKKTVKDLETPISPENFSATMGKLYPDNMLKEIYWANEKPENTLYRWYYDFIRASRDFPSLRTALASDPAKADAIAELDRHFGNLSTDFSTWWEDQGHLIFEEEQIPRIEVLNGEPEQEHGRREQGLFVRIPLNISRDILLEQLNFVLEAYHPGDALRRHAFSRAQVKLYPRQRYPSTDYGLLLRIWRAVNDLRQTQPQVTWWRVYCQATGALDTLAQLEKKEKADDHLREQMIRTAKKLYKQADVLMKNAIVGQFPRDKMN